MLSVLEEFYYGNISPEDRPARIDAPFVEAVRVKNNLFEKLLLLLKGSEKELFEKFIDAESEVETMTSYSDFSYGFKLAMLMMMEVVQGKEEIM